jgi:hypothetical protein
MVYCIAAAAAAAAAAAGPRHPEVAVAALEGCLRKLMAVPQPNYARVALVLRLLIQRASSDTAKLNLYR